MFRKNVASQYSFAQMNSRTDGSPLTSAVSVSVSTDGNAQAAGAGTVTHLGSGLWRYTWTQAETNGNQLSVQFTHATGINVGYTIITTTANPQDATAFGLGNLDAAVSSRSTYAGADTAGTTTLLGRLTAGRATNLDNLDVAVSTRSSHAAADVWAVTTRTLSSFGTLVSDIATAVWGAATRTLSAFGFGVTVTTNNDKTGYSLATAPPTAAQIRTELDTNSTKLDVAVSTRNATAPDNASIAAIKLKTDNLPAAPAAVSDIPTANQNADALLDRTNGVETGWTLRQALRIVLSVLGGKLSGAATSTVTIRNVTDAKARVTATVDADGNRTAVTFDAN